MVDGLTRRARRCQRALNLDEIRAMARRCLPRGMFEYIDRGTEDEVGLPHVRRALDDVKLMPSVLVDVHRRSQATEVLGRAQPSPLVVAPTAVAGLMWHNGEIALARAAAHAGIPFCVSTQSITSIEDIAAQAGGRLWFQLYILRDRALTQGFIERARAAGADTLVVTVDTAVSPKREYNQHNGFGIPMRLNLNATLDLAAHPGWLWRVMGRYLRAGGIPTYAHYPPAFRRKITRAAVDDAVQLANDVTWDEIAALRGTGRGGSCSRAFCAWMMHGGRRPAARTPSSCPVTAPAIWTRRPHRSGCCPTLPTRSVRAWKCWPTVACGAVRMSSS